MITALIFVGSYAIVAAGRAPFLRLDRTGAAIVGAVLMVVTGAIGFDDAVRAVDFPTIVLLFSMMSEPDSTSGSSMCSDRWAWRPSRG